MIEMKVNVTVKFAKFDLLFSVISVYIYVHVVAFLYVYIPGVVCCVKA